LTVLQSDASLADRAPLEFSGRSNQETGIFSILM
jgi:hypothetical protein